MDFESVLNFSRKSNLSERDNFRNVQSVGISDRAQNPLNVGKEILDDLEISEELKRKLMDFLLLTQRKVYSPGELDLGIRKLNPHARDLIVKLTSNLRVLMNSDKRDWIISPLIDLVNRLEAPVLIKNDFYSKVVEFSKPEHFDSSRPFKTYGLQAIKQIADSNDFETIRKVFNSTVQKHGYNPKIFDELRDIDKEYNLMVKLKFGL